MPIGPQLDLNPSALIAASQRRTKFIPRVGGYLIVQLPGESMRCLVKEVIDDDTAFVLIESAPIARGQHTFQFNEIYGVRRRTQNSRDFWEMQTEHAFLREQQRLYAEANPPPVEKARPAKKAQPRKKAAPKNANWNAKTP